jgi:hypothetical protein
MEKAAKENMTEEIIVSPEEIVDGVKEEVKEAPSRIRQNLRQLVTVWERPSGRSSASESDVIGSGVAGMYTAKFQALAKDQEEVKR